MFHLNLGRNIWLLSPQHVRIHIALTLEWGDVMEVYSYGNRKLFTLDQAHIMTIETSIKIVLNACIWYYLGILVIKSKPISKWTMPSWVFHTHFNPFPKWIMPNWALHAYFGLFLKWIVLKWASYAHYGPLRWTLTLFKRFTTCLRRLESFLTYVNFIIPCC